jgi:hypothetical protein
MSTIEQRREALEKRRAEREEASAKARAEQRLLDEEAYEDLKDEHAVASVSTSRFVEGQPTMAIVRMPTPSEYKRYVDQIGANVAKKSTKGQRDAQELLANSCWVYPREVEARKAMLEVFPGLLTPLSMAAAKLAEGNAEEEGKE